MIRKALLAIGLVLAALGVASAQAPSPANVGISKGSPDVFKLLGSDKVWTPFGSISTSTHIFIPGTNGPIAPNDCVKWGPGITSAGAACNSVTGGAHPANQLTIYTSHSGLVNNVTTPTEAWTVVQQGFAAPGDGGDAAYQWSFTSYCPGGTSSAPAKADGIGCVLPIGQAPSVAGRYLLSITNGELNAKAVGMQPGGQDNSPSVQALMSALSPGSYNESTLTVVLPAVLGQRYTLYYFSQALSLSRNLVLNCKSPQTANESAVYLVFPPGVDGVIQESGYLTSDGNWGQSAIRGCQIMSLGQGSANGVVGSNTLTGVAMNGVDPAFMTPPSSCNPSGGTCTVGVGDGIVAIGNWEPTNGALNVAPGAYVSASDPVGHTVTLASPYKIIGTLNAPDMSFFDLPASQTYSIVTTTGSSSFTVVGGPDRTLKPGDLLWSDAFLFGSSVKSAYSAIVGTPTVNTGGSGYAGSSGTMTWNGSGCLGSYNQPPVLNVTASGGVITGVTSVANAGQCLQSIPNSGAATWTPGGGLSGGSGASFNTSYNQIVVANDVVLYHNANALVTHSAGSPGKLWTITGGVKRRVQGSMEDSAVWGFGIGLDMVCQSSTFPITGCNSSYDKHNSYTRSLVGRLVRGNNSGVSTAIANVYGANDIADVVEAGSIGSTYLSDENNSQDSGRSIYGTLVVCGGQNYSNFIGSYLSGQAGGPCLGADAAGNPAIGVKANDEGVPSELFLGSVYGLGYISMGQFNGSWAFNGQNSYTETATAPTPSGNVLAIQTSNVFYPGIAITDLTHPVIPAGTIVTQMWANHVQLSNALTGGGVLVGDQIQFENTRSRGGPCITAIPGLAAGGGNGLQFDVGCAHGGLSIAYNGYLGGWGVNNMFMPDADYQGYTAGGQGLPVFAGGIQLGDFNNDFRGMERLLDSGYTIPSEPWHLQGDIRLNQRPVPGGVLAWTAAPSFTTSLAGAVTSGATTSVAIAACPSPGLPAGTPVVDVNSASSSPDISLSHPLGTLNTCVGTMLTLQSAATSAGLSGDPIQFLQWRPAAKIANDDAGTSWPVATAVYANALTPCNGATVGFGVVIDGETIGAAGYGATVAGGGPVTRPVFCDGTSWTYH